MPRHISEPINGSIELIDIAPSDHSPLISKCTVKVCYVQENPNRNESVITKETAIKMAPSLRGAIIAGYFNEGTEDFEEHNKKMEIQNGNIVFTSNIRPYGFVDLNAKVWFQNFIDDGEQERLYLCTEGWLWTSAYPEAKQVLEDGKGQSMELNKETLNATWSKDKYGKPQFFIINEAIIEKLVILGEDYEPCFEGASFIGETQFSLNDDFKERIFSMLTELKELLKEGGEISMETKETPEIVEEIIEDTSLEEYKKKEEDEEEETSEEDNDKNEESQEDEEEKKKKKEDYTLLEEKYNSLVNDYMKLEEEKKQLETELFSLREFKNEKDREAKEKMIASFSMLTDEDKEDVVKNIDSYSLEDIEAKLSVICFRNKKFDLAIEEETKNNEVTTYSLEDVETKEPEVPAWIRAINEVVAEKGN